MKKPLTPILLLCSFFLSCDPITTDLEDVRRGVLYKAAEVVAPPTSVDTLWVMTWNIRYGAARIPWFRDSCGDRVILSEDEVVDGLERLALKIKHVSPDILILQEIDVESKRTAYIDQVQWLLDHTDLNHGAYASILQSQFIPSEGLGRMDMGNAILSLWEMTDAERIHLALRGDQSNLTRYFYVRRNILKVRLSLPGHDNFYVVNIHAAAFSTDDTKKKHIDRFKEELDLIDGMGTPFVAGGDLNALPPRSDSTNYCDEARCPDDPEDVCPDGADYGPESGWLTALYESYSPGVPLDKYAKDNRKYFTFGRGDKEHWDRKLDYLFTNGSWVTGSDSTHQDVIGLSDHTPVSAELLVTP